MSKKTQPALKIALVGANGRMGAEIARLAESEQAKIVFSIDAAADWKKTKPADVDIVVDFSSSDGLSRALEWCVKNKKPIVSGSTGLSKENIAAMKAAAKKIPLLYSANMSLGIAVFSAMLKNLKMVGDWDFQIEEVHHNQKKDRPSGTAILLQDELTKVVGRNLPEPQSLRGGGVPGIHSLWAMGPDETLMIQHTAFNRQVFARGALKAARWLFDKDAGGIYDLSDLYKMKI